MTHTLTNRAVLVDASFAIVILVWSASLFTMMHVGYMIATFAIPLFVAGLWSRFTWRRSVLAAMGIGWAIWSVTHRVPNHRSAHNDWNV